MLEMKGRDALVWLSAWALMLAVAGPAGAVVVNRILATVDATPITLYELKTFIRTNPLAAQEGQGDPAAVLDSVITSRLIEVEIEKKGIVIAETEIENYIDQISQQNQITRDQLFAALRDQGLDPAAYRAQIRQELQRAQLINREIRGKVNVTPEDVQRYYDAHLADYEKAPEVTVSHIMLRLAPNAPDEEVQRVEAKAAEIRAQLDREKDFADLARQYSEDPAAESGGSLGTFRMGTLLDALNDAVRDLEVGQYSQPVRSDVGIHIVRLDDRSAETHTPMGDLADEIRDRLYNEALEERYVRWLKEDLRQRHHVEMLE
jgi:peptidyl-prolyl cis-trans isomerase SurA